MSRSVLGGVVCTGFDTAYKDTMRQDNRKGNEHRIVIGTVSSESDDGRKGELRQWMTHQTLLDEKQSNHRSPDANSLLSSWCFFCSWASGLSPSLVVRP